MEAREPKPLSSVHLHTQHSPCWLYEDGDIGCGGGLSLPDAIASEAPFQDVVTGRNFACGLKRRWSFALLGPRWSAGSDRTST